MLTNQGNREVHIHLKPELFIKVNGKGHLEMGMEHKHGQMEHLTQGNGKIIKPMARVSLLM